MNKKRIRIIPFTSEKGKWCMWLGKFMEISRIKVYDILLTGDTKPLVGDTEYTKEERVTATMIFLNNIANSGIVLTQEDTVCLQIFEEGKKKSNKYGGKRQACVKL